MLSDEERKAIERIEDVFYQDLGKGINKFQKITLYEDSITDIRKLLNLIEKQSKEIEELTDKNKKLKDKAKELIFEKQELTSGLLDSTPNDKIKAKIEELDKQEKEVLKGTKGQDRYAIKQEYMHKRSALQSLLEKE